MSTESGAIQPRTAILPIQIQALLGSLALLTAALVGVLTSFEVVHWSPAQTTLVLTETAAFWAFVTAIAAHLWPNTKQQPVAVAGTVTALVSATLSMGGGFAWWHLSEAQNASLVSLVTTIIAVASALIARSVVTASTSK